MKKFPKRQSKEEASVFINPAKDRGPLITLQCSSCPVYETFRFPFVRVVDIDKDVVEVSLHYFGGWEIDYQERSHPLLCTQKLISTCPACLKQ